LKPRGTIVLAYPYHRLEEAMDQLRKVQLSPTRFVRVFGHEGTAPKICLIEAIKGKAIQAPAEQTLTIYHPDGSYTQTMQDIYASFNYPERSHRLR
jgi:tRNA1(Val) A37 N6-methylase TrmN6